MKIITAKAGKMFQHLFRFLDESPLSQEAKHRMQFYTVFLLLAVPTMLLYGIRNLFSDRHLLSVLIFTSAGALSAGWFYLRIFKTGFFIYRINGILYSLLILYMAIVGGEAGSKLLWMFTFPLIAFFLLGKREGLIWNTIVFVMTMLILWSPFSYPYDYQIKTRFIAVYLIISLVSYSFEFLRTKYRIGMENERRRLEEEQELLRAEIKQRQKAEQEKELLIAQLQETLEMVKKMSGLIPICASCHKIRDDKGFWNQLEAYIQENSEAQFSHGICPDCADKIYREMGINKKNR